MAGKTCGLAQWGQQSTVTHATAAGPEGPYTKRATVIQHEGHNPEVIQFGSCAAPSIYISPGFSTYFSALSPDARRAMYATKYPWPRLVIWALIHIVRYWYIFHIGTGASTTPVKDCNNTANYTAPAAADLAGLAAPPPPGPGGPIHRASSPDGPFLPIASKGYGPCNNPSPFVHPNGGDTAFAT